MCTDPWNSPSNNNRLTTLSSFSPTGDLLQLSQVHDGINRQTSFGYDTAGRRVSRSNPNDPTLTWNALYDTNNNLVGAVEADGDGITMGYDNQHQLTSWTDGEGRTTTYTYNSNGLTQIAPPGRAPIGVTTDNRGLTTAVIDTVDGNTAYTYTPQGWTSSETTAGGTTTWTYDTAGRPLTQAGARGDITWTYDPVGNVLTQTTGDGTTTWTYDHNNQVTSATGPDGGLVYTYDPMGMPTSVTNTATNAVTSWTYDGNTMTSETRSDGTSTLYGHDGAGRQTTETDPDGTWAWEWDDRDRVHTLTRPDNTQATLTWNDDGRINQINDPTAGTTHYQWDHAGDLVSIADPTETVTYQRDGTGKLSGIDTTPTLAGGHGRSVSRPALPTRRLAPAPTVETPVGPKNLGGQVNPIPGASGEPRRPLGTTEPSTSSNGRSLQEYVMLVDAALFATPAISAVGTATYQKLAETLYMLDRPTVPEHQAPTVDEWNPEVDGPVDFLPLPDDAEQVQRTRPKQQRCRKAPNRIVYGTPQPYIGETNRLAGQWAAAVLHNKQRGTKPSINPPGWRSESGLQRAHLLAKGGLGGTGGYRNIVASRPAMNNAMKHPEEKARGALDACQPVQVLVRANYSDVSQTADQLWVNGLLPVSSVTYLLNVPGSGVVVNATYPNAS